MTTAEQTALDPFEEVRRILEEAVARAGPEYHTGVLAVEVRERIRLERPELYDTWVDLMATDALKTAIGRLRSLHRRPSSHFRRGGYDITEEVDTSHTQRRFGDMTKGDLLFIARRYSKTAATMKLRAARVQALAERMPDETTLLRDVVPETDVAAIFD
jgi:hypothetical protein